jgi:hypothetical protein
MNQLGGLRNGVNFFIFFRIVSFSINEQRDYIKLNHYSSAIYCNIFMPFASNDAKTGYFVLLK